MFSHERYRQRGARPVKRPRVRVSATEIRIGAVLERVPNCRRCREFHVAKRETKQIGDDTMWSGERKKAKDKRQQFCVVNHLSVSAGERERKKEWNKMGTRGISVMNAVLILQRKSYGG